MQLPNPTPRASRHAHALTRRVRRAAAGLWARHREFARTRPGYTTVIAALVTALLTATDRRQLLANAIDACAEPLVELLTAFALAARGIRNRANHTR